MRQKGKPKSISFRKYMCKRKFNLIHICKAEENTLGSCIEMFYVPHRYFIFSAQKTHMHSPPEAFYLTHIVHLSDEIFYIFLFASNGLFATREGKRLSIMLIFSDLFYMPLLPAVFPLHRLSPTYREQEFKDF